MSESKTVLISGGAGYVGSALVSRLLRDTNWNVKVFDNLMYGGDSLFQFFNFEKFSFIKGDLRKFELSKIVENVDYVVNLAALVGEPICKKYPKEAKEINFEANINLAKTCEKQGIERYVMLSTCSNYGLRQNQKMLEEDDELQPISLYSETKVDSEKFLLNELSELPVIVLILSAIGLLTPAFMRQYRRHSLVTILILSSLLTPPDPVSLLMMSAPLMVLYEISIGISHIFAKKF